MIARVLLPLLLALSSGVLNAPPAEAANGCGKETTCIVGADGAFNGLGTGGGPGGIAQPGAGNPGSNIGSQPQQRVVSVVAPMCATNGPGDDVLCQAALTACPDEGDIGYWVWEQTVLGSAAPDPAAWVRVSVPPYACLGPTDPAVSPTQAVSGVVQREFSTYGIARARLVVDPEGRTLVGFPTRFWTDATAYTFTRTILGRSVAITARPERYAFHFGDGTSETRTVAPRAGSDDLVHVYEEAAARSAYAVVTWSGTFSVDGGPVLAVQGTATTTGPVTAVDVREARSQYESD